MKKQILGFIAVVVLFGGAVASAETRGELKPTMKAMGEQFKILALALMRNQPTPQPVLMAASNTLVILVGQAAKDAPPQLRDSDGHILPGAEAQLAQFDGLIAQLATGVGDLQQALARNDLLAARAVFLKEVLPTQKLGHHQFRQDE